jgi:hypothetical protein
MDPAAVVAAPLLGKAGDEPTLYHARWLMLALYSLVSGMNALVWISLSSISTIAQDYYGVSDGVVNLLPVSFYVVYVPLVAPAMALLEQRGLRPTLLCAASFLVLGCALRAFLGGDPTPFSFNAGMLAGTVCVSVSTPFIFACTTALGGAWFGVRERGTATAVAVAMNQLGLVLGFVWPPLAVPALDKASCSSGTAGRDACVAATGAAIRRMSYVQAGLAALALAGVAALFRSRPPTPPTRAAAALLAAAGRQAKQRRGACGQLWRDANAVCLAPGMPTLLLCFALTCPSYWTTSVLLDETLDAKGFSARQIMLPGALLMGSGLPGMLAMGAHLGRHPRGHRRAVGYCGAAVLVLYVAFAAALQLLAPGHATDGKLALVTALCCALGFVFSALQPALLELAAELTYPLSENVSCSVVFLGSQFTGCAFVYIAEALEVHSVLPSGGGGGGGGGGKRVGSMVHANWFFAGMVVLGLGVFALGPRGRLKRVEAEVTAATSDE